MKKVIFILSIVALCFLQLNAQQTLPGGQNYYEENKGIVYNKEFTVDLKLHTHGYALGVNIGKLKTYYLTQYYNIELGELKHPKEFRQSFDFQSPQTSKVSRAFVFGKQNNFFVLRGGYGEKRYFSEKAKRRGKCCYRLYISMTSMECYSEEKKSQKKWVRTVFSSYPNVYLS